MKEDLQVTHAPKECGTVNIAMQITVANVVKSMSEALATGLNRIN